MPVRATRAHVLSCAPERGARADGSYEEQRALAPASEDGTLHIKRIKFSQGIWNGGSCRRILRRFRKAGERKCFPGSVEFL